MSHKDISTFTISTTAPEGFEHEPDSTRDYWHHQALCSGQLIPDSKLGCSSALAGGIPLLY